MWVKPLELKIPTYECDILDSKEREIDIIRASVFDDEGGKNSWDWVIRNPKNHLI